MLKALLTLFLSFLILGVVLAVGIATMIYGWGLSVQSWWWVIGGALVSFAFMLVNGLVTALAKDD